MINGAGAEFSVKFFGAKTAKVNNVVRPQVENVIPTIPIAFLNNNNFCTWKKNRQINMQALQHTFARFFTREYK